ncbi:hypothetical protein BDV26DRAFT_273396 [Aspergillus bertholletiae]|uniref:Uncharacterized protein n=1 Tax=Aspergillus bertholletiae TaxID=1226010 RepID=A0A5N7ASV4_9EURO|nr:hypothetical protein BDV26DRAFT_273396 [Aspergillus bertholletiae]
MNPPFKTTFTWLQNLVSQRVVHTSPTRNLTANQIFLEIIRSLSQVSEPTEIVYSSIGPDEGELICRSLDVHAGVERQGVRLNYNSYLGILRVKIMPINLHDVHQRWINFSIMEWRCNGIINRAEAKLLWSGVGTTFTNFSGVYQGSIKQPDHFLRVDTSPDPRIVVESGWSESFPHLRSDKDLWLRGNVSVKLVILLKWSSLSNRRIKGTAEIWRRNTAGNLFSSTMPIFPAPRPLPPNELIQFTKGELFGPALLLGQAAGTLFDLDIVQLREFASEVIRTMGMQPA